jgi:hypothetical protein
MLFKVPVATSSPGLPERSPSPAYLGACIDDGCP